MGGGAGGSGAQTQNGSQHDSLLLSDTVLACICVHLVTLLGFDPYLRCHPTNCCYTQDVFELVDRHFAARTAITSIDAQLEQQEVAFRSIQKRLLVRYKVRTAFAVCLRVQRTWDRTRRRAQPNQHSNLKKALADAQSACSSPAGSQGQLALFKQSCVAACLPRACLCLCTGQECCAPQPAGCVDGGGV